MENGVLTLWSIVHVFSGIVLAFLFSLKRIKLIEFAGFFALPFLLINYTPVRIVSMVIIFISLIALFTKHFSKRKNGPTFFHSIIFAFSLLVIWEFFEYFTSPFTNFGVESFVNKISDIVVGFAGFMAVYPFVHRKIKHKKKHRKKLQ